MDDVVATATETEPRGGELDPATIQDDAAPSPADLLYQAAIDKGGYCLADTIEFVAEWRYLGMLNTPNGRALVAGWWKPGMPNVEPLDGPLFECQMAIQDGSKELVKVLGLLDAIEALAYKCNWAQDEHKALTSLKLTIADLLSKLKVSLERQATTLCDVRCELSSAKRDAARRWSTTAGVRCSDRRWLHPGRWSWPWWSACRRWLGNGRPNMQVHNGSKPKHDARVTVPKDENPSMHTESQAAEREVETVR